MAVIHTLCFLCVCVCCKQQHITTWQVTTVKPSAPCAQPMQMSHLHMRHVPPHAILPTKLKGACVENADINQANTHARQQRTRRHHKSSRVLVSAILEDAMTNNSHPVAAPGKWLSFWSVRMCLKDVALRCFPQVPTHPFCLQTTYADCTA